MIMRIPPAGRAASPESKVAEQTQPAPAAALPSIVPEPRPSSDILAERQAIQGILDQLRQAQLKKDVNLFFDAYSPTFPNLAEKKAGILKTWQKFTYLDLNFNLANVQKKDAHTIMAEVACDLTLEDILSRKQSNLSNDYNIYFSNATGKWLIQGLTEVKKSTRSSGRHSNLSLLSGPLNNLL